MSLLIWTKRGPKTSFVDVTKVVSFHINNNLSQMIRIFTASIANEAAVPLLHTSLPCSGLEGNNCATTM